MSAFQSVTQSLSEITSKLARAITKLSMEDLIQLEFQIEEVREQSQVAYEELKRHMAEHGC